MKASAPKCYRYVDFEIGTWQANGNGGWQTIGNTEPMTIPVNGYLAVYLTNATSFANCEGCLSSEGDVYFDQLNIRFTRGNLKQESHYYPFGLPMAAIGSSAAGLTPNRQKYQSNEYITDAGLNWMSFGARQYDPQIGRFLSVDPMASAGGQDMLSPYQAMGNDPVTMTDPGGMQPLMRPRPTIPDINPFGHEIVAWNNPSYGGFTSEAIADMTPGFMPDTDPMGIGAWMDAAAAGLSIDHFWDKVMDAFNKLLPGQGQNIYNNGDGTFSFGLVYNLRPLQGGADQTDNTFPWTKDTKTITTGGFKILFESFDKMWDDNQQQTKAGVQILAQLLNLDALDGYDHINWIQTIFISYDGRGWHADGPPGQDYYYPMNRLSGNDLANLYLSDGPNRPLDYINFSWIAISSLIGYKNGQVHVFGSIYWGFLNSNGTTIPIMPSTISVNPGDIQYQFIHNANPNK